MPTTPIYALRYPAASDPADVPLDMSELALDVEGKLGGPPVTSLPGSPVDGQIVRYRVTANGPVWTFQYQSGSTAPRWHFLGGAPRYQEIATAEPLGVQNVWADLATVGPSVTVPLAGDYLVLASALPSNLAAGANRAQMGVGIGTGAPVGVGVGEMALTGHFHSLAFEVPFTGLAAASELRMRYQQVNPTLNWAGRMLSVLPVRVS